jgi:hypothetical protein
MRYVWSALGIAKVAVILASFVWVLGQAVRRYIRKQVTGQEERR